MFKGNYFRNGNDQRGAFRNFCDLCAGIRGDWSPPRRRGWGSILTFGKGARSFCAGSWLPPGTKWDINPHLCSCWPQIRQNWQSESDVFESAGDLITPWVITQGAIRARMLVLVPPASGPHLNYICCTSLSWNSLLFALIMKETGIDFPVENQNLSFLLTAQSGGSEHRGRGRSIDGTPLAF